MSFLPLSQIYSVKNIIQESIWYEIFCSVSSSLLAIILFLLFYTIESLQIQKMYIVGFIVITSIVLIADGMQIWRSWDYNSRWEKSLDVIGFSKYESLLFAVFCSQTILEFTFEENTTTFWIVSCIIGFILLPLLMSMIFNRTSHIYISQNEAPFYKTDPRYIDTFISKGLFGLKRYSNKPNVDLTERYNLFGIPHPDKSKEDIIIAGDAKTVLKYDKDEDKDTGIHRTLNSKLCELCGSETYDKVGVKRKQLFPYIFSISSCPVCHSCQQEIIKHVANDSNAEGINTANLLSHTI